MEKVKTYQERRDEILGATDYEEMQMRRDVLDDIADKVNEIVEEINKIIK